MEISLEAIDAVRERTGASYKEAKEALEKTGGSVVDAIVLLEDKSAVNTGDLLEKIKAAVKEGNVNKIRVVREGKELLNIPVNAGIAGGLIGLAVAPGWGVLAAAAAANGRNSKFEIVKDDGSSDDIGGGEE